MLTITPTRTFNLLYIIIDSIFIIAFLGILLWKKRKATFWFSIFGGILYFIVDFGYFYFLSKSRIVKINDIECNALQTGWILLWMSLSYGITNFAFIWLCIKKDEYLKEFLLLIVGWWLVAPTIAELGSTPNIMTYRTTNAYHGAMGIILIVGYAILIVYNLKVKKEKRINILWLNLIGISVQFGWEFALLIDLKNEGKTVVISTHIFSLVEKICDRVGIIINGKMIKSAPLKEITNERPLEDVFFDIYKEEVGEE